MRADHLVAAEGQGGRKGIPYQCVAGSNLLGLVVYERRKPV